MTRGQTSVVDDLEKLGYTVDTYDDALDAARRAYGVNTLTASVLLSGTSDLVGPAPRAPGTPVWSSTPTWTKSFDPRQRRDSHGRWTDTGGGTDTPGFHGDLATSSFSELARQFPTLARLERDPEWVPSHKGRSDVRLESLAHDVGYDGPPHVVPSIPGGGDTLYRGVNDERYAEQLRTGAYYGGNGVFGNGYYVTPDRDYATGFSETGLFDTGHTGALTRLRLRPGARTMDVVTRRENDGAPLRYSHDADMAAIHDRSDLTDSERQALVRLLIDEGRWAAFRGYQAIVVSGLDQTVILDRTAMDVEAHDLPTG
jgi:hypothetical protein